MCLIFNAWGQEYLLGGPAYQKKPRLPNALPVLLEGNKGCAALEIHTHALGKLLVRGFSIRTAARNAGLGLCQRLNQMRTDQQYDAEIQRTAAKWSRRYHVEFVSS